MINNSNSSQVVYFSMEMVLDPSAPTYTGRLDVLTGDTLRAAADPGNVDGWDQPCPSEGLGSPDP
jgi:hypothetical protein